MDGGLKCFDDTFAGNPQYKFYTLGLIRENAVASSVHFVESKYFQSEIKVVQLANYGNVRGMASDDQIFTSFKSIKGTLQYFYNMLLDVLFMQCGLCTVLLTCSEFD